MIIVYDIELDKGVQELGGWGEAIKKGGISCGVAQDPYSWKSWIFLKDNLDHLPTVLNNADLVVTWNGNRFDDKILKNNGYHGHNSPRYDLLQAAWKNGGRVKGWTLGETVARNLPAKKLQQGYEAPELFKHNKIGQLITYCARDVWLTCCLVNKIKKDGYLIGPNQGRVRFRLPITKTSLLPI